MIEARDYQAWAEQSLYKYFGEKSGNPLIAMPTGTGKSVVVALFFQGVLRYWPSQRMMCLTHVKELIKQNFDKLKEVWPDAPAGIYSAGLNQRDTQFPITFAGVASVAKKIHLFGKIDLLVIDEAHLVSPNDVTMYRMIIDALRKINPLLKVIGLTATPWRLGQGMLTDEGGIFTDIACDMTSMEPFNWFIEQGYLSPLIPRRTATHLDPGGVHMRGGEFIAGELQNAVDKAPLTEAAVREMLELASDRRSWLVFCSGVQHTEHVAEMLTAMGIECAAVHSSMTHDRTRIIDRWKNFDLRCIANNNVMTTGIDHPGLDFIGSMRPTASAGLWVQMLGRGTRPLYADGFDTSSQQGRLQAIAAGPKQNCLVLDFARNTKRLGPINDPVKPNPKGKGGGDAPIKECDNCQTYVHASVRVCPHCGFNFPAPLLKIKTTASSDALIKADIPIVETFSIKHITYSMHTKQGRPAMMKVTYYSGLRSFNEFVCFEHTGYALHKAHSWWKERANRATYPSTTLEALTWSTMLQAPTHLQVWSNKKFPEIMKACFDGSAFGTQPASNKELPSTNVYSKPDSSRLANEKVSFDDMDDDIPF